MISRLWTLSLCAVFVCASASLQADKHGKHAKVASAKTGLREVVVKAELIDGKTHWTPARIEVVQGEHFKLKMEHDLKEGFAFHGVEIPELGIRHQVNRHQHVALDAKVPADLKVGEYPIRCQFHPAHVGAILDVKAAAAQTPAKASK